MRKLGIIKVPTEAIHHAWMLVEVFLQLTRPRPFLSSFPFLLGCSYFSFKPWVPGAVLCPGT